MIKILFVCLGNICRSPMAEFIMKDLVKKVEREKEFFISSAATSDEEEGHAVYYYAKEQLNKHGISCDGKTAVQMEKSDYDKYDYIIAMEERNVRNIYAICGGDPFNKVHKLLDYTDAGGDIADPWYTRNFALTYEQIEKGCKAFLKKF